MMGRIASSEQDRIATIRWCGLALLVAGVLLIPFVVTVMVTGQVLPVPARQALEAPSVPAALFVLTTVGEILLLPGSVALYLVLSRGSRAPMTLALACVAISGPLFVVSRMSLLAATQLSDRYLATADPAVREVLIANADLAIETQNMNSTAALLLLCIASFNSGVVMLRSRFSKWIGGTAILAGALTVFSPFAVMIGVPLVVPFIGLVLGAAWQIGAGVSMFRHPG